MSTALAQSQTGPMRSLALVRPVLEARKSNRRANVAAPPCPVTPRINSGSLPLRVLAAAIIRGNLMITPGVGSNTIRERTRH
jgi:hypothetical protein